MSEKEKKLVEAIAALPEPVQKRFYDQVAGAALALDMLGGAAEQEGGDADDGAGDQGQPGSMADG